MTNDSPGHIMTSVRHVSDRKPSPWAGGTA